MSLGPRVKSSEPCTSRHTAFSFTRFWNNRELFPSNRIDLRIEIAYRSGERLPGIFHSIAIAGTLARRSMTEYLGRGTDSDSFTSRAGGSLCLGIVEKYLRTRASDSA